MLTGFNLSEENRKNTYINYKCGQSAENWGALTLDINFLISQCDKYNKEVIDINRSELNSLKPKFCKEQNIYKEFYLFLKGVIKEDDIIPF